jgi:glycosyltransferase involved in cell wall biosynthesis
MDILITNEWLVTTGGTGTFTYTLASELTKRKHNVFLYTNDWGELADRICNDFGVKPFEDKKYDLILANHHSTVKKLFRHGITIQTCHGIFPYLEQPSAYAHGHVAISQEVQNHLLSKGFSSTIIYNGIDCDRFASKNNLRVSNPVVLSLCHSEDAHIKVKTAAVSLGMGFKKLDKRIDWKWEVEDIINECDIVVGLGRSAYEAMACGRPVVIYDKRHYAKSVGDGYFLNKILSAVKNNCSGRYSNREMDVEEIKLELSKYSPMDGGIARMIAEENFNMSTNIDDYFIYLDNINDAKEYKKLWNRFKRKLYYFLNIISPHTPKWIRVIGQLLLDKKNLHEYY